ncbi:hypothetical protein HS041_13910 [Planomonospora sp. ID67723]|uniref:hypothetical protein n=1 Tax=Planomonospora sp. ID67723 TaxID=2738134 RepID=UPI0018C3D1E3|nr:hypothetical protein [Planomonospora sp. ID67723]MBG0828865.1 hypothetical protein [Planomonospora sp. ID67723]
MHVPPSPGRPEQPREPEILTGPAGEPAPRRKHGLAIAAASALTAAIVSAGAVFVLVGGPGDGGASPESRSPQGTQGAQQDPGAGDGSDGDGSGEAPEEAANGSDGGAPDSDSDAAPDSGDSGDARASGDGDPGGSDGKPATSTSGKKKQGSRQGAEQPEADGRSDPQSDGPPGFIPPNPPIGGY